jgi:hypothetical protein
LSGLFHYFFSKTEVHIIILGLDHAGKTVSVPPRVVTLMVTKGCRGGHTPPRLRFVCSRRRRTDSLGEPQTDPAGAEQGHFPQNCGHPARENHTDGGVEWWVSQPTRAGDRAESRRSCGPLVCPCSGQDGHRELLRDPVGSRGAGQLPLTALGGPPPGMP